MIAFDKVKCLTLGKADFGLLLNGARSSMVQVRKMRVISDQQALGKPKQGPAEMRLKIQIQIENLNRRMRTTHESPL